MVGTSNGAPWRGQRKGSEGQIVVVAADGRHVGCAGGRCRLVGTAACRGTTSTLDAVAAQVAEADVVAHLPLIAGLGTALRHLEAAGGQRRRGGLQRGRWRIGLLRNWVSPSVKRWAIKSVFTIKLIRNR